MLYRVGPTARRCRPFAFQTYQEHVQISRSASAASLCSTSSAEGDDTSVPPMSPSSAAAAAAAVNPFSESIPVKDILGISFRINCFHEKRNVSARVVIVRRGEPTTTSQWAVFALTCFSIVAFWMIQFRSFGPISAFALTGAGLTYCLNYLDPRLPRWVLVFIPLAVWVELVLVTIHSPLSKLTGFTLPRLSIPAYLGYYIHRGELPSHLSTHLT